MKHTTRSPSTTSLISFLLMGFAVIAGFVILTSRSDRNEGFDRNCGVYLEKAVDAYTIGLAEHNLDMAVAYLESANLTKGHTSIFRATPDEDIGLWYTNLKSLRTELQHVPKSATQLERTNVLMKLRKTLLDKKGETITVPAGIAVFPDNREYFGWCTLAVFSFVFGSILGFLPNKSAEKGGRSEKETSR